MYIHNISLKNVRGFESLDFDLARPDGTYAGWTVFTGDNGSGKSTLLKSIAVCLTGKETARALQPSFHRWIRQESSDGEASIQTDIVRVESDDELTTQGKPPGNVFPAKLVLKNGGKETTLQSAIPAGKQKSYQTPERTIWSSSANGWFSCGYGPFRRVFGASSAATQIMVTPSTARFATMFQEAASLAEADRWLRDLKYKERTAQSFAKRPIRMGSDTKPRALDESEYRKVIASRPDTILLTSAFGLQNTRSPRAVAGRSELAKLAAKKNGGAKLTKQEKEREKQLQLFADVDEEP